MNPAYHSFWLVLTLTAGAVTVVFSQNISAFPDTRGPYFTRINGPGKLKAGERTTFTCSADCNPPCKFTWSLNGQTAQGSNLTFSANGFTSTVEMKCTSVNPKSGEEDSSQKSLEVESPVSVKPAEGKEPSLSQPFYMTCVGYAQRSTIKWLKNNKILIRDAQMSLSPDNATLSFSSLLPSHVGLYRCISSKSEDDEIISTEYYLAYGSVSVNISGPNVVKVNNEYTFVCEYKCGISCQVYWTYRGGLPSGSYSQQKTVIKWTPATANTTQLFTCVAENKLAARSAEATKLVRILSKSEEKVKPKSGSMALEASTALCLMVCVGLLFLRGW